jgi:uncharacterized caspase-like protein
MPAGWRTLSALILFSIATVAPALSADGEKRYALVIGNADYKHTPALANPANDSHLLSATLGKLGFSVDEFTDLDLKGMRRAFQEFYAKVKGGGSAVVALVYYAGHGVQLHGTNYLIPVDARIDKELDVEIEAVKADLVTELAGRSDGSLNIVILDACRNNPFARNYRVLTRGLAKIDAPTGTLISFSTAPGQIAADGPRSGNSPFTAALAKSIVQPGLRIEDVFKQVRQSVLCARGNAGRAGAVGVFIPGGRLLSSRRAGITAASATTSCPLGGRRRMDGNQAKRR